MRLGCVGLKAPNIVYLQREVEVAGQTKPSDRERKVFADVSTQAGA